MVFRIIGHVQAGAVSLFHLIVFGDDAVDQHFFPPCFLFPFFGWLDYEAGRVVGGGVVLVEDDVPSLVFVGLFDAAHVVLPFLLIGKFSVSGFGRESFSRFPVSCYSNYT